MTEQIEAEKVSKFYLQHLRPPGVSGAVRSLFSRQYREIHAVQDISFTVRRGESVGYLGPNGAGKSTMIKMLTGILVPSSGRLTVFGHAPHAHRSANARRIGVVFGQRSQLWWDLPVVDSFRLHKQIYGIESGRFRENLDYLTGLLEIGDLIERPVRQLSLGQRMRCELVLALLHDPEILFLDEPTIGLDVVAKDVVRRFLARVNVERELTIILTTHDMQDIEQLCPRLIMVDGGRVLFDDALSKLRTALGVSPHLHLLFASDPGALGLDGAELLTDDGRRKVYRLLGAEPSLADIIARLPASPEIRDASIVEPAIEEVIRSFYRNRLSAA